ncbi:hypothetical protein D3C72_1906890 [compost metagenome]
MADWAKEPDFSWRQVILHNNKRSGLSVYDQSSPACLHRCGHARPRLPPGSADGCQPSLQPALQRFGGAIRGSPGSPRVFTRRVDSAELSGHRQSLHARRVAPLSAAFAWGGGGGCRRQRNPAGRIGRSGCGWYPFESHW